MRMSIHDHVKIHMILFWGGVAITVVGSMLSSPNQPHWLIWGGLGVFLLSFVYRLITVKCPHCGDMLLGCRVIPKHCPNCGKELEA